MIKKRTVILVGVISMVILALCVSSAVFAYGITRKQWEGPATRAFANVTGFPAGRVADEKATYTDYLGQIDAQRIYLKTEDARSRQLPSDLTPQTREAAYNQIIQIAALDQLAEEYQVSINREHPLNREKLTLSCKSPLVGIAMILSASSFVQVF